MASDRIGLRDMFCSESIPCVVYDLKFPEKRACVLTVDAMRDSIRRLSTLCAFAFMAHSSSFNDSGFKNEVSFYARIT